METNRNKAAQVSVSQPLINFHRHYLQNYSKITPHMTLGPSRTHLLTEPNHNQNGQVVRSYINKYNCQCVYVLFVNPT